MRLPRPLATHGVTLREEAAQPAAPNLGRGFEWPLTDLGSSLGQCHHPRKLDTRA